MKTDAIKTFLVFIAFAAVICAVLPGCSKVGEEETVGDNAGECYRQAVAYKQMERYPEAVKALNQAIRIKPAYAKAYYCLGTVYVKMRRYPEAVEAFKQAISIKPDYTKAYYELGEAYNKLRRYGEAVEVFKRAVQIKPAYAKAHYGLGLAYLRLGDADSAMKEYDILDEIDGGRASKLFNLIQDKEPGIKK